MRGLRAAFRVLIFVLLTGLFALAIDYVSRLPLVRPWRSEIPTFCLAVLASTGIMARFERRPFTAYGLDGTNPIRNFAWGLAVGFAGLCLVMGVLSASGLYHLSRSGASVVQLLQWGLTWILSFVFVSLAEELFTRGYPLFVLSGGIGFWPSAVILALIFGAGHIGNRGEEIVGIFNAVIAGLVFAYSVWWTGSLWWAIGCHLSWDWAETFFFGVSNSGIGATAHHFLGGAPSGPAWLSGGSVGPEGSVLATVVLLAMAAAVRLTGPQTKPV